MTETTTGHRSGLLNLAARWWPALAGLALGILVLIDADPWQPSEPTTVLLPVLAIAYLVFGAVRGQLRRQGVLRLQMVGLIIFGGCALLAVLVAPEVGHYIAGAGWIGHAAWDVAHHRDLSHHYAVGVVPRGYAESCIVIDLLIGASLIATPAA
jgi:small basic protein